MITDGRRKYIFNLEAFDEITTEEQAYWLGFLIADGCINHNGLIVELHQRDKNHLKKLNIFMKGNSPIKDTKQDCCKITFNSCLLRNKLEKYGLVPNKSYSTKTPDIANNLLVHFYRGIFDGDGWITSKKMRTKKKVYDSNVWEIGFSSANIEFIKEIKNWICLELNKEVGYFIHRKRANGQVCQLTFGGNKLFLEIYNVLFKNATIYLDRKYNKFQEIIEELK